MKLEAYGDTLEASSISMGAKLQIRTKESHNTALCTTLNVTSQNHMRDRRFFNGNFPIIMQHDEVDISGRCFTLCNYFLFCVIFCICIHSRYELCTIFISFISEKANILMSFFSCKAHNHLALQLMHRRDENCLSRNTSFSRP